MPEANEPKITDVTETITETPADAPALPAPAAGWTDQFGDGVLWDMVHGGIHPLPPVEA